jgi:hypothetical protein
MRIRIALSTAVAVIVIPSILFTLFSINPATAARARHEAGNRHRAIRVDSKLTSYSRAQRAAAAKAAAAQQAVGAQLAAYADAVTKAQEEDYLKEYAYLKAVAAQKAAAAAAAANTFSAIPAAWVATAICEEGGRNDPNYGYFGIKAWGGFDGYPRAGSAPLSVQLAWEARYIGSPPDAPGQCHAY